MRRVAMPLSSKRSFWLLLTCVAVLGATFIFLWLAPVYLEHRVLPSFFQKIGIANTVVEVRGVGLTGIDLGYTAFGDGQTPWFSLDTLEIDYTVPGLLQKEITGVTISGLQVEAVIQNGRLVLPALAARGDSISKPGNPEPMLLPIAIHRFLVRSGRFIVVYKGNALRIPFSLEIDRLAEEDGNTSGENYACSLALWPRGQYLKLAATIHLVENRMEFSYAADDLRLGAFADLIEKAADAKVAGSMAIRGKSSVQLNPPQLLQLETTVDLAGLQAERKDVHWRNMVDETGREKIIRLTFSGDQHQLSLTGENILFSAPYRISLPRFTSDMALTPDTLAVQGTMQLEYLLNHPPAGGTAVPETPIPLAAELNGSYSLADGIWDLSIVSRPVQGEKKANSLSVVSGDFSTTVHDVDWMIKAQGEKSMARVEYSLHLADLAILAAKNFAVKMNKVSLSGKATLVEQAIISLDLKFDDLDYTQDTVVVNGNVGFTAVLEPPVGDGETVTGWSVDGRLLLEDFSFHDRTRGLNINRIRGEMPLQWPVSAEIGEGKVRVDDIEMEGRQIGALAVTAIQDDAGFVFAGVYKSKLLGALSAKYSGRAIFLPPNPYSFSAQFHTTANDATVAADLGRLHPSLKGYLLDGFLELTGDAFFSADKRQASLVGSLRNGMLTHQEKELRITGIQSTVVSPDIFALRTLPKQHLSFAQASLGNFVLQDGEIDFQVESSTSLFLEKSAFSWAGGRLFTNTLRINTDKKDYAITFFCDRLKLAPLLEQFGAANAVSDGEVSGRIPVSYADGQVHVGEGFLYSTPGEGGIIKMTGTDLLVAGIPKDTPQFAQVDFAMAALRNFNYNWVKLQTAGEGEDLILKMELDGQPAAGLPFEYDNNRGMFIRVEPGAGKGIFQPIRLDVNFRLPLNRFLEYGSGIGNVMERLQ
jgi:hypothetical protein